MPISLFLINSLSLLSLDLNIMEPKNMIFGLYLFLSAWAFVGYSQGLKGEVLLGLGGGPVDTIPCMQKLLPCQPYLKTTSTPPASCCAPLKEMVSDDTTCLCAVFNNPEFLKSLNITQDEALHLAKACGANANISVCKKETAAPTGSPSTPSTPSTSNTAASSNSTKSAAYGISPFGTGAGFVSFMLSLVISAF